MTPEMFRQALNDLHMNQMAFANNAGVNPRTVRRWASGESPIPPVVDALLCALLAIKETGGIVAVKRALE